jgi:hypothetical protein
VEATTAELLTQIKERAAREAQQKKEAEADRIRRRRETIRRRLLEENYLQQQCRCDACLTAAIELRPAPHEGRI